jgi:putative Ca2+/H+ antiporter (TMEM165/GDT1 family)
MLQALLVSTGVVALAEMGDKTQLLSLVLAARFRRPWPIIWGILLATVANHALAGVLGAWLQGVLGPVWLRWILGLSFIAMAVWMLVPDELDDTKAPERPWGAFVTTLVTFFLVEIGDKTQVATVALAARYDALAMVVIGTTLGMMLANVPAVLLGERIVRRVPIRRVHQVAAAVFAVLGVLVLAGVGGLF